VKCRWTLDLRHVSQPMDGPDSVSRFSPWRFPISCPRDFRIPECQSPISRRLSGLSPSCSQSLNLVQLLSDPQSDRTVVVPPPELQRFLPRLGRISQILKASTLAPFLCELHTLNPACACKNVVPPELFFKSLKICDLCAPAGSCT
jgi:hypothetical protein